MREQVSYLAIACGADVPYLSFRYNPNNKPSKQGGGGTGRAGCGKPRNSGNSFSGGQAYCSAW